MTENYPVSPSGQRAMTQPVAHLPEPRRRRVCWVKGNPCFAEVQQTIVDWSVLVRGLVCLCSSCSQMCWARAGIPSVPLSPTSCMPLDTKWSWITFLTQGLPEWIVQRAKAVGEPGLAWKCLAVAGRLCLGTQNQR